MEGVPGDRSAVTSAEQQRALAGEADGRGDQGAALTHLAAACAFGGDPRNWLALAERVAGDTALHALAETLDALDHPDLPEELIAETAVRVAERANALDLADVAEDALGTALRERPADGLRRRFLRALRETLEGGAEAPETYRAGRNDPCPCGSGRKFKRCHGSTAIPAATPRSSDGALLLQLVTPYISDDTDGAAGMLDTVRRWVPREPAVNVLAGLIDQAKGDRDGARRHFRLAAQGVERDFGVHRALLEAAIGIAPQDHDLAVEILERAPPGPDPTSQGLAGALALALGYPREAVPLLERAVSSHEDPTEADRFRRGLARAWRERGDHASALRTLDAIGEPDADDKAEAALLSAWAGDASLERRCAVLRDDGLDEDARAAEAIAALLAAELERAAARLDEGDDVFPAEHWRAEALDALGRDRDAQAARRACATGIAIHSDELALQLDCALALDGPEAAKRRSEERAFTGLSPLRAIGRLALRLGDVREAEAAVRHLLAQAPRDVETLLLASEWQAGRGEVGEALRHLDEALAVQPRRHRLRVARAELLRQLHRTDEAQRALEELVRESPASWRYRVALAELLDERGDVVRAREEWQAAHRAAPDVPAVARAIGRLEGEDRAFVRAREDAERSVRALLGEVVGALAPDARAAAIGSEQDWRSLDRADDHSTVVTQLAKAVEIELMRRVFEPFRSRGAALSDAREDVGGFGKWCRGQIGSLSLGEMAFALGALARDERSALLDAFHVHASEASAVPWDLGERLAVPLRTLATRRNAAVHKEPVSRAEAEDSRRTVLGRDDREGLLALIVARFPLPAERP